MYEFSPLRHMGYGVIPVLVTTAAGRGRSGYVLSETSVEGERNSSGRYTCTHSPRSSLSSMAASVRWTARPVSKSGWWASPAAAAERNS